MIPQAELANYAQLNATAQQRLASAGPAQARLQGLLQEMQAACSSVQQTLEAHPALLNASGLFFTQCDQVCAVRCVLCAARRLASTLPLDSRLPLTSMDL